MRAPLHPDVYDAKRPVPSWWAETAPPAPAAAPLSRDARAEIAVIGAGYAGLSCAATLAEAGADVRVLDAGPLGWGASGRNGGIVGLTSDKLTMAERTARVGEAEARRSIMAQIEGAERLRAFCAERGIETQGDAEALIAHDQRSWAALQAECGALRWGVRGELLSREAYQERGFSGPEQHGALLVRPGFALHPMQLVLALAAEAQRQGATLHPGSAVAMWQRDGADHVLQTAGGALRARRVVLATNGFTRDDLHPAFAARAMPVISMIGVTRPLTREELSRHCWRETNPLANTRRMLYYWRMLPQRRLLFGMRGDLTGADASGPRWRDRLRRHLARAFPHWADIPLTHFWRGPICATRAYAPAVGRLPDDPTVLHAFGWHGSGVNGAQVAGRLLARVALGEQEDVIPALWRGLPPRIPLPGLRPVWLTAMLAGYRALDAWDAR
ncbi:MAG: NAD(P)/FAD-dependent oxidoreductase [Rubrimonas sp.]